MMRYSFALAGLLVLGAPLGAHAQAGQQGDPVVSPADTAVVELVLRREVFSYPTFDRRDPFMPLLSLESGPRYEQMRLTGIAFDPVDGANSMAVVAAEAGRGGAVAAPVAGQPQTVPTMVVRRLKVGERWGNVRVVRIEQERVVVDVNNFGVVESRVMLLQTRSQGGS